MRVDIFKENLDLEASQECMCLVCLKGNKHDPTDLLTDKLCGVCLGHKAHQHELTKQQHNEIQNSWDALHTFLSNQSHDFIDPNEAKFLFE